MRKKIDYFPHLSVFQSTNVFSRVTLMRESSDKEKCLKEKRGKKRGKGRVRMALGLGVAGASIGGSLGSYYKIVPK